MPGPRARILVIEPMYSGVALLPVARELGMEIVVASFDRDDRRLSDRARRLADRVVVVDTNDDGAVHGVAVGLHAERPLRAVIPGFEYYVPLAARIAGRLGLPGLPPETVSGVRDKAEMLTRMRRAGLRVPAGVVVADARELADAAARVGFPCVLKPLASSGSVHVSRADTLAELRAAYRRLVADSELDLGRPLGHRVLVSEYVDGPEFSVDGFVLDQTMTVASITGKLLGPEPRFVELGHIVQSDVDIDTRGRIERYVRDVVRALGVTLGPFHCELRLAGGEPVLIELGARLGGDHIVDLVDMVTGISLPAIMLAAYTGSPMPQAHAPTAKYAGIRYFTAPEGMTRLTEVRGLADLAELPAIVATGLEVEPGAPIPPAGDSRCRVGYAIFTADTYPEALRTQARIAGMVHCG